MTVRVGGYPLTPTLYLKEAVSKVAGVLLSRNGRNDYHPSRHYSLRHIPTITVIPAKAGIQNTLSIEVVYL